MTREFFEKHYPWVRAYLRRLGAGNMADDLAQVAFITLCRTYGHLPDSDLEKLIPKVARSRWIDWCRKGKLPQMEEGDAQASTQISEGSELDRLAELEERERDVRRVRVAIARLSRDQQVVMVLGDFLGYSDSQIAGLLGITQNAVHLRRTRAMQELKHILQEEE